MTQTPGTPNPIDLHVGSRVRMRRKFLGISQEVLAHALGLTFQQVQKYERGANRISASKLFEIGRKLQVPVSYFFKGLPDEAPEGEEIADPGVAFFTDSDAVKLSQDYIALPVEKRAIVRNLARDLRAAE